MCLPIIRLRNVDLNASTVADDPINASCTLYSFLRPVPTPTECEAAMEVFKCAVRSKGSSGVLSCNNARVVNLINASVQDGVLRNPPKVVPSVARSSQVWRTFLRGKRRNAGAHGQVAETEAEGLGTGSSNILSTGGDNTQIQAERSHTPSIRFEGSRGHSRHEHAESQIDSSHVEVVRETVSMSAARFRSPYEPVGVETEEYTVACYLSPDTTQDVGSDIRNGRKSEMGVENLKDVERSSGTGNDEECISESERIYKPHPVLSHLLEQIRTTLPVEEDELDRREREFSTLMESKAAALHTKLESALSSVPPEETETVAFLQHLKTRVTVAEKLFQVERHEEETIQIAHCTLMIEVEAMRRTLKGIMALVQKAEERLQREGPRAPYHAEELHFMAMLQRALEGTVNP
ncbi:uncharacterized protein TEOVI_000500600 [Trypanosoma equiperdum]|uniref:Uncharacterized protein n=1 Tax=Trypanosoma equiperdum TaxID=5694 RepID=A0A1G4I679_TRYEQ|nr:hypothetical protein, conserved [Trypanosoma equiperdum]